MQNLREVLLKNFVPWTRSNLVNRVMVARSPMNAAHLPEGMTLTPRKLHGKRVIVKNGRLYGNVRQVNAYWPQAGMCETEHVRAFWVVSGQVNCQVGNYVLGCKVGDFVIVPPRTPLPADRHLPHLAASNVPGQSCLLLWISLYRRGFQCWLSEYGFDGQRRDSATENYLFLNGQMIQLFHMFIEEAMNRKNALICNSLLTAFGAALQYESEDARYLLPGLVVKSDHIPTTSIDFTQQLEDYIRRHLDQQLSLDHVAREFYMSRTQFVRRMRQETGKSFIDFLNSYRIKEAQMLLRESEWTVQTIAQFVGFKSPTYFQTFFLRRVGCTPGEYRRDETCHSMQNGPIEEPVGE